jgi:hypothetical protein
LSRDTILLCVKTPSGCLAFAGFGTWAGLSEIWTLTAITFERCKAISSHNMTKLANQQVSVL